MQLSFPGALPGKRPSAVLLAVTADGDEHTVLHPSLPGTGGVEENTSFHFGECRCLDDPTFIE